jgi:hypothetical protein
MLHAFSHRKSSLYRTRYVGRKLKDNETIRRTQEDEITSIIFTPLSFMPTDDVGNFWLGLLSKKLTSVQNEKAKSCEMQFWPSGKDRQNHKLEPDMYLSILLESGKIMHVVVELKWNAPLSNKDYGNQLLLQWEDFFKYSDNFPKSLNHSDKYHIFIGKETSDAIAAISEKNVWLNQANNETHLVAYSWFELLSLFKSDTNNNPNMNNWLRLVGSFLENVGIRPFKGFAHLPIISEEHRGNPYIFFLQ